MRAPSMRTLRKKQLLKTILREIQRLREYRHYNLFDEQYGHCQGMIRAAHILDGITDDQYDRLSELNINAAHYRRMEPAQPPYTWLVAPAKKVAA